MILVSELGDETFIIAAIMAMRHSRLTVRPVPPIPAEFTRLPLGLSADRPRFRSPVPIDSTGLHWRHRSAWRDDRTIRGDGMGRPEPGEVRSRPPNDVPGGPDSSLFASPAEKLDGYLRSPPGPTSSPLKYFPD